MPDAFETALASGAPRIGIFFRLGIIPPFRMWLGIGDCRAGIDAQDGAGEIYSGAGEMLNVPAFQQLINGVAERVTFQLSGLPPRAVEIASGEADSVKGVALNVGLGVFDGAWQLVAQPIWLKRFVVDFLTMQRQQGEEAAIYTLALSARSIFSGRKRPGLSFFTDEEQQRRSPGDQFCQHARRYAREETKAWPRGG
jgi:hypothetical protein